MTLGTRYLWAEQVGEQGRVAARQRRCNTRIPQMTGRIGRKGAPFRHYSAASRQQKRGLERGGSYAAFLARSP